MLGLAQSLFPADQFQFLLFSEGGRCQPVLSRVSEAGFNGIELLQNAPHFAAMIAEVAGELRRISAHLLCCYGYKADLIGLLAARRAGLPVVGVSQGWTAATAKVRLYEMLDRLCLRKMDHVVCVSEAQARKVLNAGVRPDQTTVIRDSVRGERFEQPDPAARRRLAAMFPHPPACIVGSAGRLSPEKGFGVLVEAAAIVTRSDQRVGFVHFGDGPLREPLEQRISALGLEGRVILAGFRDDLDRFLPYFDLCALPSFTEGLPNVVLESYAAGVPVVATAVGGTPEVMADGVDGYLVPPGDPAALARRILDVLSLGDASKIMGRCGQERIRAQFTFEAQAQHYRELFQDLIGRRALPR